MNPRDAIVVWIGDLLESLRSRLRAGGNTSGKRSRTAFGREGERLAERHLRRQGFRIVARNFRAVGAEIDLIAMDKNVLVFVEVKRLRDDNAGPPEEAIDDRKEEQIRRAAEMFALRYRAEEMLMRFDVIAISGVGRLRLEHFRDAF